jgi:hypothetical protein
MQKGSYLVLTKFLSNLNILPNLACVTAFKSWNTRLSLNVSSGIKILVRSELYTAFRRSLAGNSLPAHNFPAKRSQINIVLFSTTKIVFRHSEFYSLALTLVLRSCPKVHRGIIPDIF